MSDKELHEVVREVLSRTPDTQEREMRLILIGTKEQVENAIREYDKIFKEEVSKSMEQLTITDSTTIKHKQNEKIGIDRRPGHYPGKDDQ